MSIESNIYKQAAKWAEAENQRIKARADAYRYKELLRRSNSYLKELVNTDIVAKYKDAPRKMPTDLRNFMDELAKELADDYPAANCPVETVLYLKWVDVATRFKKGHKPYESARLEYKGHIADCPVCREGLK